MNIELGLNKKVRRAYGIDEIALVPGNRTLDYDLTDPSWSIGDIKREVPIVASAMDSVVDVNTAVELTKLGSLGVIKCFFKLNCSLRSPTKSSDTSFFFDLIYSL